MQGQKSIYELKLHEKTIVHDGILFIEAIKVHGGWIYNSVDKGNGLLSSVFVVDDREIETEDKYVP